MTRLLLGIDWLDPEYLSQGEIPYPLWWCCAALFVAAMAGNALGYAIGAWAGPEIFLRERASRKISS